jgi:hypothetical protein
MGTSRRFRRFLSRENMPMTILPRAACERAHLPAVVRESSFRHRSILLGTLIVSAVASTSDAAVIVQNFAINLNGSPVTSAEAGITQSIYGSSTGWIMWSWDNDYVSYQGVDPLQSVTLRISVDVAGTTAPRTLGARYTFFTGWSPMHQQYAGATTSFQTDAAGHWEQTFTFTGSQLNAWFQPPYGPNGSMYGELFGADADFSAVMSAELTFVTVPAPAAGAVLAMGAGCLRRRRRH